MLLFVLHSCGRACLQMHHLLRSVWQAFSALPNMYTVQSLLFYAHQMLFENLTHMSLICHARGVHTFLILSSLLYLWYGALWLRLEGCVNMEISFADNILHSIVVTDINKQR